MQSLFEITDGCPAPVLADSKPLLGSATEGVRLDRVGPAMCLSASLAVSAGPADSDFVDGARIWDKEKACQRLAWSIL